MENLFSTEKSTPQELEGNVRDILIAPDSRLRQVAEDVSVSDVNTNRQLVADMFSSMYRSRGMGLAAPQIGINKRIIVLDVPNLNGYESDDVQQDVLSYGRLSMLNPIILDVSQTQVGWAEGCLSVPGFQHEVLRPLYVVVGGNDEFGRPVQIRANGLLAACLQHEIDHLNGKLFFDYLSRLKQQMVISKLKKFRRHGRMIVKAHQAAVL